LKYSINLLIRYKEIGFRAGDISPICMQRPLNKFGRGQTLWTLETEPLKKGAVKAKKFFGCKTYKTGMNYFRNPEIRCCFYIDRNMEPIATIQLEQLRPENHILVEKPAAPVLAEIGTSCRKLLIKLALNVSPFITYFTNRV